MDYLDNLIDEKPEAAVCARQFEKVYKLTKSLTNAYYQCYNFDLETKLCTAIKQARSLVLASEVNSIDFVVEKLVDSMPEKSASVLADFLDFSDIDERMGDRDSIYIECENADGKWLRLFLIVAERDFSGYITSITLAIQDIDEEKMFDIERAEALQEKIDFFGSVSVIYETIYQIDFVHNDFIELSNDKTHRFLGKNLKQAWEEWIETDFNLKSFKENREFLEIDTLQDRLAPGNALSRDIHTVNGGWKSFIVIPYKRDEAGTVTDALLFSRSIDSEKMAELKRQEELRVANIAANLDGLTGIPNRTALQKYVIENEDDSEDCFVSIFDIDNFKKYNDTYGHVMGDETLKSVASSINAISCGNKHFCCRYGGEEFVLIAKGVTRDHVASVLEDISTDILQKDIRHIATVIGKVSVSIGFAKRAAGETILDTLKRADDALYHSKQNGRNQVTFASKDIGSGQRMYDVTFSPSATRFMKKTKESAKNDVDELTEALKVRSHQLEVVLSSIPGGMKISRMDDIFSYKYVSREAAEMFGYTINEFIEYTGNSAFLACIGEDRARVREAITASFDSDRYMIEYRVRCKDGSMKYVTDSGKKVMDIDGEEVFYSLYLDVTDERRMEEQASLASVFTALSVDYDSVTFINYENDSFRDFYVSDRYESVSEEWRGYSSLKKRFETFAGTLVYEVDRERFLDAIRKENVFDALRDKPAFYINYRIYREDGSLTRAQTKLVRDKSDPSGQSVIMCYISLDGNGKRKAE